MKTVKEGKAKIIVPGVSTFRDSEVFYNPEMSPQRDLAMAFLRVYRKSVDHDLVVCDPLAGSGVRGIRMLKEVKGIRKAVINDLSPGAVRLARKNFRANHIATSRYEVRQKDARVLLMERKGEFDYIDIDPFGSPIYYTDTAALALRTRSLLACTAMDTGALAGSFGSTCMRRYGIMNAKTDFLKEMGVRVLVTAIMRDLLKYDYVFTPMINQQGHFFRVIGKVERSGPKTSDAAGMIKVVSWCRACLWRAAVIKEKCPECGAKAVHLGPVWTGPLHDREFCAEVLAEYRKRKFARPVERDLERLAGEIDEPFYYDMHKVYKSIKAAPGRMEELIEELKGKGFQVSRTHFCPTGIRTNAGIKDIKACLP